MNRQNDKNTPPEKQLPTHKFSLVSGCFFISALSSAGIGALLFGLEALYYLKEGGPLNLSVIAGLKSCGLAWADDPQFLHGLHQLLKRIPAWTSLFLLAAILYAASKKPSPLRPR